MKILIHSRSVWMLFPVLAIYWIIDSLFNFTLTSAAISSERFWSALSSGPSSEPCLAGILGLFGFLGQAIFPRHKSNGAVNSLNSATRHLSKSTSPHNKSDYRKLLDSIDDVAYEADDRGNITYANKVAETVTGLPLSKIVARPFLPLFAERDRKTAIEAYSQTLAGHSPEYELTLLNGKILQFRNKPKIDDHGIVIGVLGMARDITERKRVDQALRDSDVRYRTFVQNFQGISYRAHLNRIPIFFHGAVEKITGYTEKDFVSGIPRWDEIVHPEDWQNILLNDGTAESIRLTPNYSAEREYRIIRKDGRMRWVHDSIHNICGPSGKPEACEGIIYDITKRKRAEDALIKARDELELRVQQRTADLETANNKLQQQIAKCRTAETEAKTSEGKIRAWFNHSPDILFIIDHKGTILHSNYIPPDSAYDSDLNSIYEYLLPEYHNELRTTLDKLFAAGDVATCDMHDAVNHKWYTTRLTPIINDTRVDSAIIAISDITCHINEEQQLRHAQKHLNQLMTHIPDFITVVDNNGTILSTNHPVPSMTVEDTIGLNISGLAAPAYQQSLKKELQLAFAGKAKEYIEVLGAGVGGPDSAWYELRFAPLNKAVKNTDTMLIIGRNITDRKLAFEALRESENKYRTLVESITAVVCIINYDGTFLFGNTSAAASFGTTPKELIGKTMWDIFPRGIADRQMADVRKTIQSGQALLKEVETIIRGNRCWYNIRLQPIRSGVCGLDTVLLIGIDISALKQAEQELRRFKSIADNANYAMAIADLDGTLTYVNEYYATIHGYSPEELVGQNLEICHTEEQLATVRKLNRILITSGKYSAMEVWHKHRDGATFPMLMNAIMIKDGNEAPQYLAATAIDITALKKAETALINSREEYRTLFSHAQSGMFRITFDGSSYIAANRKAAEIFECTIEELKTLSPQDFWSDPADRAKIWQLLEKEGKLENYEGIIKTKTGKQKTVLASYKLYRDKGYLEGSFLDITSRKLWEERLLFYQAQLRRMAAALTFAEEKERREMAACLHDTICQDLAVAKLRLTELKEPDERTGWRHSVQQVDQIISKALNAARSLTRELVPPVLLDIGLSPAIKSLAEQLQKDYGLDISVEEVGQGKKLSRDLRTTLYRGVRELLLNVIKHANATHVNILIRNRSKYIIITVHDDGVGFSTWDRTKETGEGNSFGLFSIRERLEYLGGRVAIKSERGIGAEVILYAPAAHDNNASEIEDEHPNSIG